MTRFLITGGSGFIGTHIVASLLKNTQTVVLNIDIQAPKIKEHEKVWQPVDLCDKQLLTKTVRQFCPDQVIHLAARTDLRGLVLEDYAVNMQGVSNLMEALDQVPTLRQAIFASSMYVCYPGYTSKHFDDYAPHTLYGESKVITEKIIKEKNPSNYTWSIIRPTSIWGPYFGEPYDKFFRIVLSHCYFHMGEKACKKTYGYIDNTVYQILSILQTPRETVNRKTFYIGDYEPYDITEWADEIAGLTGIKIPYVPYVFFQLMGKVGDLLKSMGITFPMTSFRLKNMTTNNIHDLNPIRQIAPSLPVTRIDGTKATIEWIQTHK